MAVAGGLGLRTENVLFPCEARPRLPFVKSCVWVTCAREDEPAGPRTRAGQSWRAFFFFLLCGRCFPTAGGLCVQCWGPSRSRSSRAQRYPRRRISGVLVPPPPIFFLHGGHAARGSGAGPREPVCGGYGDNLSQACGEQPLGCRLFPFVNLVLKARPSLQPHGVHCCHAPGSCCSLR